MTKPTGMPPGRPPISPGRRRRTGHERLVSRRGGQRSAPGLGDGCPPNDIEVAAPESAAGYVGSRAHPRARSRRVMSPRRRARLRRSVLGATTLAIVLVAAFILGTVRDTSTVADGWRDGQPVAVPVPVVPSVPAAAAGSSQPVPGAGQPGSSGGSPGSAPLADGESPAGQPGVSQQPGESLGTTPRPGPVVVQGSGSFRGVTIPGADTPGTGRQVRYSVEVEGGLEAEADAFATAVAAALRSPRGWQTKDRVRFVGVSPRAGGGGPRLDVRVILASPRTVDRLCYPLRTNGEVSCYANGRVLVNQRRWVEGAPSYGANLDDYRTYLINHEVGHALGHGHISCPARGAKAPIMLQQTLGLNGCLAWPYPVH